MQLNKEFDYTIWFIPISKTEVGLMQSAIEELKSESKEFSERTIKLLVMFDGNEVCETLEKVENGFNKSAKPNLILLYTNISGLDAREVLKVIKSRIFYNDVPVVIFTVASITTLIEQCYDLRANSYVVMHNDIEEHLKQCKRMLYYWLLDNVCLS